MTAGVPSLPIIDIAPYLADSKATDADRAATAAALHAACRDIGFFYLRVGNVLNKQEMDEVLELGREFFHRPQEEKESILIEKGDGARGYQRLHQNVTQGKADHHEGFDMYAPSPYGPDAKGPLTGENQWPKTPARMQPALEAWVAKMKDLGYAVMHAMSDGLGLTEDEWKGFWGLMDDSFWSMRVIGYPPMPAGHDGVSCGEHKDYGCLTFLHADPCPNALQVLGTDGTWLNADPIPGCVVVNIGAMWEHWTGGLYPATMHRVVHVSPTFRVSVPFFFEPNYDAPCKLLPAAQRRAAEEGREVKDDGTIIYGDYLMGKVSSNFKY